MKDKEHAKKYAEESISLAISMCNPKAEDIAFFACLYGLTYKNDEIKDLEAENNKLLDVINNQDVKIADLEKENAELKMQLEEADNATDCFNKQEEIITKAKEIIKGLLPCCRNYPQENAEKMKQAEQFLKENGGEK